MPTVSFKSRVQATSESCSLALIVQHRLQVGQLSEIVYAKKIGLPDGIPVHLASQLVCTISGAFNDQRASLEDLQNSHLVYRLLDYLRLNAAELGIHSLSDPCISGEPGKLTFSCKSSKPYPICTAFSPTDVRLLGLDFDFVWKTGQPRSDGEKPYQLNAAVHPFSSRLSLSYATLMNIAVDKFVKFHLVRRYPLIFGSWSQQLDTERQFFDSMLASINRLINRSHHSNFKDTCTNLFKRCAETMGVLSAQTTTELSDYLGSDTSDIWVNGNEDPDTNLMAALSSSMEMVYISGLGRPLFRVQSWCYYMSRLINAAQGLVRYSRPQRG
ncbi:hypothetical protein CPC08DRAFT_435855 [Agrocybe pediades]|nr:hypothetical protein CPC08DRAFT_435855 [Agrocybe pediades]